MLKNSLFSRYILNGIIATSIHYSILLINVEIIKIDSIGIANFIAAIFGIFASFIGNKYFVFNEREGMLFKQVIFFMLLYFSIALIHGVFLYIWSDMYDMDYRIGFIMALIVQVLLSYTGNKKIVFI
jgi:putative flippase GtrA